MSRPQSWKLELPHVEDPVVEDCMRKIKEWTNPFGGSPSPNGFRLLALLIGGQHLTATLGTGADTEVPHELNRVPETVMLAHARDGLGGFVYGESVGGTAANAKGWTRSSVFLRASRAATYDFVIY